MKMTINDITAARISVLSDEDAGRIMKMIVARKVDCTDLDLTLTAAGQEMWNKIQHEFAVSDARAEAGRKGAESTNNPDIIRLKPDMKKKADMEALADRFNRFWAAYPRHVGKQVAVKAFEKIHPDEETLTVMLNAIDWQKNTRQWRENNGQFIPHPSTWLNQRRWEDERPVQAQPSAPRYSNPYAEMLAAGGA